MKPYWMMTYAILLLVPATLPGQAPVASPSVKSNEIPAFIIDGMNAYKEKGPDEALKVWIKDSPIDGSKDALSQANVLRQVQDYYGAFRDFNLIAKRELTPKSQMIYLELNFEKGPLFARFIVYKPGKDWILALFNFNTNPTSILPDHF